MMNKSNEHAIKESFQKIKFSRNWNNKLNCNVFSTIRKFNEEKYQYYKDSLYKTFKVMFNNEEFKKAVLVNVGMVTYSNIPMNILAADTGYVVKTDIDTIFKNFGISGNSRCIILTFSDFQTLNLKINL